MDTNAATDKIKPMRKLGALSLLVACTWGTYGSDTSDGGTNTDGSGTDGNVGITTVATGQGGPSAITLNPGNPYELLWANMTGGYIMVCTLTACTDTSVFVNTTGPEHLVIASQSVVWSRFGATNDIEFCPLTGCSQPVVLANNVTHVTAFATSNISPNLYWADNGQIMFCNWGTSGPCAQNTAIAIATNQMATTSIAVNDPDVYWVNSGNNQVMGCTYTGNCSPTTLATLDKPFKLQIETGGTGSTANGYMYVSTATGIQMCTAPSTTSPCTFTPLVTTTLPVTYLAHDSSSIYYATTDGTLSECPNTSCPTPKVLATNQGTITAIRANQMQNTSSVYWTTSAGNVMMTFK